ncbi:hypothetical protein JW948_10785 [bacterium]|nr:hypothetical protein [bacterium]
MDLRLIVRTTVLSLVLCMSVPAQPGSRTMTLGMGAGTVTPLFNAAFRDYWRNAGNYDMQLQFHVSGRIALVPRFAFHVFQLNQDRIETEMGSMTEASGGELSLNKGQRDAMDLGLEMMIFFTRPDNQVGFYMTMGGSGYWFHYRKTKGYFKKAETSFTEILREEESFYGAGPHGGFGLDLWFNQKICFSSEIQMHAVWTTLAPSDQASGRIERILLRDSSKTAFLSFYWGMKYNF